MTRKLLMPFLVFISFSGITQPLELQPASIQVNAKPDNKYGAWLLPSKAENIYGIAVGVIGSEVMCNAPYTRYSHGINLQLIGQGIFQTFWIGRFRFSGDQSVEEESFDTTWFKRVHHNGLLLSTFGTFSDQVNGVSVSPWMSVGVKVNGLTVNLLWSLYGQVKGMSIGIVNECAMVKGVQVGLINEVKQLRGFQFGLWNKNEKRSLPLVNWNFKGS